MFVLTLVRVLDLPIAGYGRFLSMNGTGLSEESNLDIFFLSPSRSESNFPFFSKLPASVPSKNSPMLELISKSISSKFPDFLGPNLGSLDVPFFYSWIVD